MKSQRTFPKRIRDHIANGAHSMHFIGAPAIQAHSLGARDVRPDRPVDAVATVAQEDAQADGRKARVTPPAVGTRIVPGLLQQHPQLLLHPSLCLRLRIPPTPNPNPNFLPSLLLTAQGYVPTSYAGVLFPCSSPKQGLESTLPGIALYLLPTHIPSQCRANTRSHGRSYPDMP